MEPETFKPNLREASDLLEADQIEKVCSNSNLHAQPSEQANLDSSCSFSATKAVNATPSWFPASPSGHIDQYVANKQQLPLITPRTKLGEEAQQSRGEPSQASSAGHSSLSRLQRHHRRTR